jgi:hypothetical protein
VEGDGKTRAAPPPCEATAHVALDCATHATQPLSHSSKATHSTPDCDEGQVALISPFELPATATCRSLRPSFLPALQPLPLPP